MRARVACRRPQRNHSGSDFLWGGLHAVSLIGRAPIATGLFIVAATALAIAHLGDAVRVGLPDEATQLNDGGLYGHSRNPIDAGILLSAHEGHDWLPARQSLEQMQDDAVGPAEADLVSRVAVPDSRRDV